MKRFLSVTLAAALTAAAAAVAQDDVPVRPESHGSLINGGALASLDVLVVG